MQILLLNGCSRNDTYAQQALALLTAALGEGGDPPQVAGNGLLPQKQATCCKHIANPMEPSPTSSNF